MTLPNPVKMMGAPGSPYTRKMRAVLRYRRIPYLFIQQNFSGNAKQQLLHLVRERCLVQPEVFSEAVERAGVAHLLL